MVDYTPAIELEGNMRESGQTVQSEAKPPRLVETLDPWANEGPAPKIPQEDQVDLRLYFSEELRIAAEGGGGSNFDAMTDRLALYSQRPKPCKHCGGVEEVTQEVPMLWDGKPVFEKGKPRMVEEVVVEEKPGSGLELDSHRFKEWRRIERLCGRPTGTPEVQAWLLRHNEAFEWVDGFDRQGNPTKRKKFLGHGDYFCQQCRSGWKYRGLGNAENVTVRITGQIPKFIPNTGGNAAIARIGRVGRKRAAVRAFDLISERMLEIKFSPGGDAAHAAWHETPTGKALLQDNRQNLPPAAYFTILRRAHEQNTADKGRKLTTRYSDDMLIRGDLGELFELCNREAGQLVTRMHRAWCKVALDG